MKINCNKMKLFSLLLLFLAIFSINYIFQLNKTINILNNSISVNYDTGFYNDDIKIKLSVNSKTIKNIKIYYTLNGDDPTTDSNLYKKEIKLKKLKDATVYPLKMVAYYQGKYSKIIEKNYVICDDIKNRYNLNVISLTSSSENLYDYYKGILVKGITYDKNKKNNNINEAGFIEGNYNMRTNDWIRNAHITMFNKEGKIILNDNIGIAISGGSAATHDIKSFKIISDEKYGSNDKFHFVFSSYNDKDPFYVDTYKSLRLRSGGQDSIYGSNIKSSVFSYLANQSNFDGASQSERAVVYLNGNFYGIFDIEQNFSDSFIQDKYDLPQSNFIEKYKGSEYDTFKKAGIINYFNRDLNNEKNRMELEKKVDMDNYLLYFAINILVNNNDWPIRNFEIWHYTGPYDENNKYTDGKYRFLAYDHDLIYRECFANEQTDCIYSDVFRALMENKGIGSKSFFKNIMSCEYYRNKFITILTNLMNTTFQTSNVLNIIEIEYGKIEKEVQLSLDERKQQISKETLNNLIAMVIERNSEIEKDLEKYFNIK